MCIDIYEIYGKISGFPNFEFLRKNLYPFAINFYSKIHNFNLSEINGILKCYIFGIPCILSVFEFLK